MKVPEANSGITSIADEFDALKRECLSADNVERLKNVGEMLFTKDDIYTVTDPLARLFRKLCVENNISEEYFNEKYRRYSINVLGKFPHNATNNRTNNVKMLKNSVKLTWRKFLEFTTLVLGLKINNLAVDVEDLEHKVKTYSSNANTIAKSLTEAMDDQEDEDTEA